MSGARSACGALLIGLFGVSGLPRSDLVETSVSISQHGPSVTLTDVVRNRGDGAAPASTTSFLVAHVRIGTRRVGLLRAHQSSRRTSTFVIPRSVPAGTWRLYACADVRHRVRESNERNNCRAAKRRVVAGDVTPPKFAGLVRATTCIPGPVGGTVRDSPYALTWTAASDNVTPQSELVYEIYAATAPGTEDFVKPTYVTDPGATTFVTPPLPDNVQHYFVVRARDRAGDRDSNRVERLGQNLCL